MKIDANRVGGVTAENECVSLRGGCIDSNQRNAHCNPTTLVPATTESKKMPTSKWPTDEEKRREAKFRTFEDTSPGREWQKKRQGIRVSLALGS